MPWNLLLNPTVLLAIALASASAFGWLQTTRLHAAQDRVIAVQATFDQFKAGVAAEGKLAQQRADAQAAIDRKRKEVADANHKAAVAVRDQRIASMRHDADSRSSYSLPAPEPSAPRPDIACFDRGAFELATRSALESLRGLADECDAAIISLNIAKAWAKAQP